MIASKRSPTGTISPSWSVSLLDEELEHDLERRALALEQRGKRDQGFH